MQERYDIFLESFGHAKARERVQQLKLREIELKGQPTWWQHPYRDTDKELTDYKVKLNHNHE